MTGIWLDSIFIIQLFCIFGYISYQASRISGNARYHKENFLICYSFLNSLCNHKFINLDIPICFVRYLTFLIPSPSLFLGVEK